MSASRDDSDRSLSPLNEGDSQDPNKFFEFVENVLRDEESNKDELKDIVVCLNEMRLDPHRSPSEKEQAAYLLNLVEDRLALYTNRSLEKPVRTLRFTQANRDAVTKVDIHGLLSEKDVIINRNQVLGEGSFGVVYGGTMSGLPVAIKVIKDDVSDADRKAFINEAEILARMRHPYCCEYVGYLERPFRIVTRRYPTNLFTLIESGTLSVNDCFRIAYQTTSALQYIHSIGLIHRDLKSENIFIDEHGDVRIADFGFTQYAPDIVRDESTPPGSLLFLSPEQLLGRPFTQKCEVYTLGIVFYELFTGREVFEGVSTRAQLIASQMIVPMLPIDVDDYSSDPEDEKPPKAMFDLIEQCYSYNPDDRPELSDVMKKIMDIAVHYIIRRSESAAKFWKMICMYTYRDRVLLSEFVDSIRGVDPRFPIAETIKLAVSPSWQLMDINHFWFLCCWFPNFFRSKTAFAVMENCVRSKWFSCDEKDALKRLRATKTKSFVIRPSTTNPVKSPFTLCVVVDNNVQYFHINRHTTTTSITYSCDLIGDVEFASIVILAKYIKTDLGYSIASKLDFDDIRGFYA